MKRFATSACLCLGLLACSFAPLHAHTFTTPDSVWAASDGSFHFEAGFTAGPGSYLSGGWEYHGTQNISMDLYADCFCIPNDCTIPEGESFTVPVDGSLTDISQPGTMHVIAIPCSGAPYEGDTVVMPYDPTPVESTTWGLLKALYR